MEVTMGYKTTRRQMNAKQRESAKCWRCNGDGYYFRVPDGFNPFLAGAVQAANVSTKIICRECRSAPQLEK